VKSIANFRRRGHLSRGVQNSKISQKFRVKCKNLSKGRRAILAGEGAALSVAINAYVKILETTEIEVRISALEAREKIAEDA